MSIYGLVFNLLLRRVDPERAHALAVRAMKTLAALPGGLWLLRAVWQRASAEEEECLRVRALGLSFPSPLGVAAGVDKEAGCFEALGALGFGFVEVGTLTARAQEGNERPRVFRVASRRALVNRMGFPNPGAGAAAERLRRRSGRTLVGANVGKSRAVALADAAADYGAAVRQVGRWCDYVAVNVSSPNTPGLRELQTAEHLGEIVGAVREALAAEGVRRPVLVKIGPDVTDAQIEELAEAALSLRLDGIVAVNTTLDHSGVEGCREIAGVEGGGVSGAPLRERSLEVLRRLHALVGEELVLVSVGGIESAQDAWERIGAGAALVQGYTAFVYNGPGWARRVNRGLAQRVRDAGGSSIQEFVGSRGRSG